ncbi:MAG TPA: subclass B3 metallo-beta-lactamase [Thermoanaerobaculia bacterium]|nr:subclass B3 metallo-beta-lactamase [Thermoanaerobaculia bacterium]
MRGFIATFALCSVLAPGAAAAPPLVPDPPIVCESCDAWNAPHEPFRVFGNTYYVGVAGLSAVLIATDQGLILIDAGLPQSAPLIDTNIRRLGFRTEDLKLILNGHAHYDHAGGIAALQRASGATVATSEAGAQALRRGEPTEDDPQFAFGPKENAFPAVAEVRAVRDGETLRLGSLAITAHHTPGHTPGSTSWSWRSCEGERCLDVVYADSLAPVSAPGFRFTGDASHPSRIKTFRSSIAKIGALPCDILLSPHPGFSGMDEKLAKRQQRVTPDPFIDPESCRAYAAKATAGLEKRITEEQAVESR